MNVYLIESYSPHIKLEKGSKVVALTPEVCYQLDKEGIRYSIIEDYYNQKHLIDQDDEYYQFQLNWIKLFDDFLQENIPNLKEYNLKMANLYFYFLKTFVMDNLYLRCYQLLKLFDKLKPKLVTYSYKKSQEGDFDFTLQNQGFSYFSKIIPFICKEKNIDINPIPIQNDFLYTQESKKYHRQINKEKINKKLAKIKFFRDLNFFVKFGKDTFFNKKSEGKLNLLLLKTVHNGEEIIKDGLKRNHNIFLLKENKIMKYSSFGERKYCELSNIEKDSLTISEDILEKLKNNQLIKQFNHQCKLDVSDLIVPKLEYFILKIVPELYNYYLDFINFYKNENIDFVITPHKNTPIEHSAIAAANDCKNVKSVGVDHGYDVFIKKYSHDSELESYDIYICTDKEIKNYLDHLCTKKDYSTNKKLSSHKFSDIQKIKQIRSINKKDSYKKKQIIYLPAVFKGDHLRMGSWIKYTDTWYYGFQKALIEFFSTKKDYVFIWKGLLSVDVIYNPIPDLIKDKKASNIKIATNSFKEHLLTADKVICDYPSTGFYESLIAGIPTISLCHKDLKIRDTAIKRFGQMLQPFSTKSEAVKKIKKFLDDKPRLYTISVDTEDKSVIDILEEIN